MENEIKYYHPNPDEFHIGFEYEEWNTRLNQWDENKCGAWSILGEWITSNKTTMFSDYPNPLTIRVKYLDKEDIEEILQIKQLKGDKIELNFQLIINDYLFYEFDYDLEEKILIVEKSHQSELVARKTGRYDSYTLFHGIIKNKSEFKKLLKQLNISNDMETN